MDANELNDLNLQTCQEDAGRYQVELGTVKEIISRRQIKKQIEDCESYRELSSVESNSTLLSIG